MLTTPQIQRSIMQRAGQIFSRSLTQSWPSSDKVCPSAHFAQRPREAHFSQATMCSSYHSPHGGTQRFVTGSGYVLAGWYVLHNSGRTQTFVQVHCALYSLLRPLGLCTITPKYCLGHYELLGQLVCQLFLIGEPLKMHFK